jgi:hypothetical protein
MERTGQYQRLLLISGLDFASGSLVVYLYLGSIRIKPTSRIHTKYRYTSMYLRILVQVTTLLYMYYTLLYTLQLYRAYFTLCCMFYNCFNTSHISIRCIHTLLHKVTHILTRNSRLTVLYCTQ